MTAETNGHRPRLDEVLKTTPMRVSCDDCNWTVDVDSATDASFAAEGHVSWMLNEAFEVHHCQFEIIK
jgi:hypothetical protein